MREDKIRDLTECPECKANWDDGDIAERLFATGHYEDIASAQEAAKSYGWTEENKVRGSRVIGIEIQGEYDGISYWKCPDCSTFWDRFTGRQLKKGEKL